MGANLTVYCLQKTTDYSEFERLANDLMSKIGYHNIEPLGGQHDKGRDAIFISRSGKVTIFAYSVKEDWKAKLAEDSAKIARHGHKCDNLVFVTSAAISATDRDTALAIAEARYGWNLEIYGVERLRVLLDVQHPELKRLHPQIFPPEIIKNESILCNTEGPCHVILSYSAPERYLAEWLAKKLASEGYSVWCKHLPNLAATPYPTDIDHEIRTSVACLIAIFSPTSITDAEAVRHRVIALDVERQRRSRFVIPITAGVDRSQLDIASAGLEMISFEYAWLPGLMQVIERLESFGCPRILVNGRETAAKTLITKNTLSETSETVFSNMLQVLRIPEIVKSFTASREVTYDEKLALGRQWSFRKTGAMRFLSLQTPPDLLPANLSFQEIGSYRWSEQGRIEGIDTSSLVSELIRKALIVKCHEKGLLYCRDSQLDYFPDGLLPNNWLGYCDADGKRRRILAAGTRKYWRPHRSLEYRYALAPLFTIQQNLIDSFTVLAHLRIRFASDAGQALVGRIALSRRKHLTKDWWNDDWLNRLLAVIQFLADGADITIGRVLEEQLIVSGCLTTFRSPVSIQETDVEQAQFARDSLVQDRDYQDSIDEAEEQ